MGLICLCGLDRTGKSTVAAWYETQGYEIVHLSAPDKKYSREGYTRSSYFEDYVEMLMSFNGKDIVMDRFWDGELIWPKIYNRAPLLSEEEIDAIREIEQSMEAAYILMHDPNSEAHWQRCVDNKEPLTKAQFVKARSLYSNLADKYDFQRKTLKDFPDAVQPLPQTPNKLLDSKTDGGTKSDGTTEKSGTDLHADKGNSALSKTKEQLKLERANVINEVLSKRILKGKGSLYDDVERSVRHFLNTELGKILGTNTNTPGLTNEEVDLLKFFCKRLKDKENE